MTENLSPHGLPIIQPGINQGVPVIRNFMDSVFRMLFSDKENLLSLYNALNGTDYDDPDELEINTLENAIYLGRKNDISFVIHNELHLYEHQSTVNPNMPLRSLIYISALYEKLTAGKDLYTCKPLKLPWPSCVVFYNGTQDQPDEMVMRLSDLYSSSDEQSESESGLEHTVHVININRGRNEKLMQNCEVLRGYGIYVDKVRRYRRKSGLAYAVDRAVSECISEGILVDFLQKNRAEVKSMSIFEYNQEEHFRQLEQDAIEMGLEKGMEQGLQQGLQQGLVEGKSASILELLSDLGVVSDELRNRIQTEKNPEILSKWLRMAAKAENLEAFEQQTN